jgi:hypothetical protein
MSDTTRLEDRLATAWSDAPPLPPVGERLAAGHRALRRQRILTTAVTTFAAVAAIGVATAVTGGTVEPRTVEPAPAPAVVDREAVLGDFWAAFDAGARLVVRDDVTVLQRVDGPLPDVRSVALDLRRGDAERWYLVTDDGSDPTVAVPPEQATPDTDAFLVWVHLQDPTADPTAGADPAGVRDWVHLAADGRLVPVRQGVTVLRSVADPDVPGFTDGTYVSVAAALRVDGERSYVLARRYPDGGPPQYFRISVRQGGPTLETMLDFARQKYGSGAGLR